MSSATNISAVYLCRALDTSFWLACHNESPEVFASLGSLALQLARGLLQSTPLSGLLDIRQPLVLIMFVSTKCHAHETTRPLNNETSLTNSACISPFVDVVYLIKSESPAAWRRPFTFSTPELRKDQNSMICNPRDTKTAVWIS